jgi:hypothetical protein
MFGLSKKTTPILNEMDNELQDSDNSTDSFITSMKDLEEKNDYNVVVDNEPVVLRLDSAAEWDKSVDWSDDISWSKVLISESESLRHTGTINRQQESAMVILVKRLELFPTPEIILAVRKNLENDILKINSVRNAMQIDTKVDNQGNIKPELNPILSQTGIELTSELNKISIEKDSFEKKIKAETGIIQSLVENILNNGKSKDLLHTLLHLYEFRFDTKDRVYHISSPIELESTGNSDQTNQILTEESQVVQNANAEYLDQSSFTYSKKKQKSKTKNTIKSIEENLNEKSELTEKNYDFIFGKVK